MIHTMKYLNIAKQTLKTQSVDANTNLLQSTTNLVGFPTTGKELISDTIQADRSTGDAT